MPTEQEEPDFSKPSPERDRQITLAFVHFFDAYCKAENVPDLERHKVNADHFLGWLQTHIVEIDREEMSQRLRLGSGVFDFAESLSHAPGAVQILMPVWNTIITATRAEPRRPVKSTKLMFMLEWEDGTLLPVMIHTPVELLEGGGFTDGAVCTLLHNQAKQLTDMVLTDGLDGLYAKFGDNHGGEEPFTIIMSGVVKEIMPKHPPEMQALIGKYLRLIQACVKPMIPPQAQKVIDARRAKKAAEAAKTAEGLVGGFDAPPG